MTYIQEIRLEMLQCIQLRSIFSSQNKKFHSSYIKCINSSPYSGLLIKFSLRFGPMFIGLSRGWDFLSQFVLFLNCREINLYQITFFRSYSQL